MKDYLITALLMTAVSAVVLTTTIVYVKPMLVDGYHEAVEQINRNNR